MSSDRDPTSPAAGPAPAPSPGPAYAAFISYRHAPSDRRWARWIHRALETYRTPAALVRKGLPARVGRCFRDEDELPASSDLNAEIERALVASRFLVVVCSPRTPQSQWVNREVERFRELGRGERILALLIEGEPGESFPKALTEIRRTVTGGAAAAAQQQQQVEQVEPLAADVRPTQGDDRPATRRRMARLRLAACVLGVAFDDLRRREQERRNRALALIASALATLVAAMTLLTAYAVQQRGEAIEQRTVAAAQAAAATREAGRATAQERRVSRTLALVHVDRGWKDFDDGRAAIALLRFAAAGELDPTAQNRFRAALLLEALPRIDPQFARAGRLAESAEPGGLLAKFAVLSAQLQILDLEARTPPPTLRHPGPINDADVSADGRRIVTACDDGAARVWDLTGRAITPPLRHDGPVRAASFGGDGARVLTAGDDGAARVWDAATGAPVTRVVVDARLAVTRAAFAPDAARFLTATAGGVVRVWHAASGLPASPEIRYVPPPDPRAARDGAFAASLSDAVREAGGGDAIAVAAFSPDGRRVLTVGTESGARLWNASTAAPLIKFPLAAKSALHACFGPDGTRVACVDLGGTVRVWGAADLADVAELAPAVVRRGQVFRAEFSASGRQLITAGMDGRAEILDAAKGEPLAPALEHAGPIALTSFGPGGTYVLTASADKTARVWDASNGRPVSAPLRHQAGVFLAKWAAAGEAVLTIAGDTATVWPLARAAVADGDLVRFAELMSAHRLDEVGNPTPLTGGEWGSRLADLSARYPERFVAAPPRNPATGGTTSPASP